MNLAFAQCTLELRIRGYEMERGLCGPVMYNYENRVSCASVLNEKRKFGCKLQLVRQRYVIRQKRKGKLAAGKLS
jgi:hypothetical protein